MSKYTRVNHMTETKWFLTPNQSNTHLRIRIKIRAPGGSPCYRRRWREPASQPSAMGRRRTVGGGGKANRLEVRGRGVGLRWATPTAAEGCGSGGEGCWRQGVTPARQKGGGARGGGGACVVGMSGKKSNRTCLFFPNQFRPVPYVDTRREQISKH